MNERSFQIIVIGGGHAGVEAAWACANLLPSADGSAPTVALITLDPTKVGVMSCNPAIGGLAKGQLVREIDAMGGLMGLATDATGIQFKVLNQSKGPAVHGPRAQCDKHAYAEIVQGMIASRREIRTIAGSVESLGVRAGRVESVTVRTVSGEDVTLLARAVVLTTGTFMRGLMHCGEQRTAGGRFGEAAAAGISGTLRDLGFELGRLKTGTPPRLRRGSIAWESLADAPGDAVPVPFSDLTRTAAEGDPPHGFSDSCPSLARFPVLPQVVCKQTRTTGAAHELIRANLHRAPMYSGQIESVGPRYCPSIEDKVVRFADRESHGVFLEPESLRDDWVYCNGISTSLPPDVQDAIVRSMPGCEHAKVLRYGYAVEYDMVRPHQIDASGMTKSIAGLFLAGQINGTSGYEEAGAQGLIAGINAARYASDASPVILSRDRAYIGVLMDDLVTKTPVEPYRMFTSRAEYRLLLRSDNAPERLTPLAAEIGLLRSTHLGRTREAIFESRTRAAAALEPVINECEVGGKPLTQILRSDRFELEDLERAVAPWLNARRHAAAGPAELAALRGAVVTVHAERRYEAYIQRQRAEIRRHADMEHRRIPQEINFETLPHLRAEARQSLHRFRPGTFGQASRLEGMTPSDLTLLAVLVEKWKRDRRRSTDPGEGGTMVG